MITSIKQDIQMNIVNQLNWIFYNLTDTEDLGDGSDDQPTPEEIGIDFSDMPPGTTIDIDD